MRVKKQSFSELVAINKREILSDSHALKEIEVKLEKRLLKKVNKGK